MSAEHWVILELLGHRVLRGRLSEVELAGAKMLKIEVPVLADDGTWDGETFEKAQRYGAAALYGCHDSTEDDTITELRRHHPSAWRRQLPPAPGTEGCSFCDDITVCPCGPTEEDVFFCMDCCPRCSPAVAGDREGVERFCADCGDTTICCGEDDGSDEWCKDCCPTHGHAAKLSVGAVECPDCSAGNGLCGEHIPF